MSIQSNFPAIAPTLNLSFALTKELDPRITFTRASTATYYGTQTAKAEENLLTFSQEFDNAYWAKLQVNATANSQTAPNGTTTAETIAASSVNAQHRIYTATATTTINSSTYTQSWFVKSGTHGFVQLAVNNQGADFANFDLGAGTVGTTGGGGSSAVITSVGSGWYRVSMSYTAGGVDRDPTLALVSSASAVRLETWTPAGTETVFLWGAQLEQRDAVTAYTPTTTQPITNYIPVLQTAASGVARFDHNPTTFESLGLLIEEQRTNLLTYSEQFDDAAWTKSNATITANTVVAPDGTLSADKLVENTAADVRHTVQQAQALGVATYTGSFYAKAGERTRVAARRTSTDTTAFGVTFDLISGVVVSTLATTAAITPVGNGWYRCSFQMVQTSASSAGFHIELIKEGEAASGAEYTGDGYSGIYIWGAQME